MPQSQFAGQTSVGFTQQGSLITDELETNAVWKIITPPAIEPVTLAELKDFAHIDTSDEDTTLTNFIKAARQLTEQYLSRALISQAIVLGMDIWPGDRIELPMPPLIDINEVRTLDEDDTETVYASTNYFKRDKTEPGQLVIKRGVAQPINSVRDYGGFEIEYVAGYGDQRGDVPEAIRFGIMAWAAFLYENRTPGKDIPPEAKVWLDSYRIVNI